MAEPSDVCRSSLPDVVEFEHHGSPDVIGSLLGLAWFQQHQLAVVVSLVGRVQDCETTVADLIERARRLGTASPAAIGAAASLVGVLRESDERAIARLLAAAIATFDERDLIAGSMALTASLSLSVADALDLDVGWAHREMIESATGNHRTASWDEERRSGCARSASASTEVPLVEAPVLDASRSVSVSGFAGAEAFRARIGCHRTIGRHPRRSQRASDDDQDDPTELAHVRRTRRRTGRIHHRKL